jgi:hypothetical protein
MRVCCRAVDLAPVAADKDGRSWGNPCLLTLPFHSRHANGHDMRSGWRPLRAIKARSRALPDLERCAILIYDPPARMSCAVDGRRAIGGATGQGGSHQQPGPELHIESLHAKHTALYQVPTKALNQALKRNVARFPEDFAFRLWLGDFANWRSQIVTSNPSAKMVLRRCDDELRYVTDPE